MSNESVEERARRAADELFENGQGEHADRLAMMKRVTTGENRVDEVQLGGWCKQSVIDIIAAEFTAEPIADYEEAAREILQKLGINADLSTRLVESIVSLASSARSEGREEAAKIAESFGQRQKFSGTEIAYTIRGTFSQPLQDGPQDKHDQG